MANSPSCFLVMPSGQKLDPMGGGIDFDFVYRTLILPAVTDAGMTPLRADEDLLDGGSILHGTLGRMLGADVAVFDLTTQNANVVYELGIRHALRPQTTMMIAAQGTRIPSGLAQMRVIFYELNATGRPDDPEAFRRMFVDAVRARLRSQDADSPVYHWFPELRPPDLGSMVTAPQPEHALNAAEWSRRIAEARRLGAEELAELEEELGDLSAVAPEVVLALFDAYRSTGDWHSMIRLVGRMRRSVAASPRVQEQLAIALNRVGQWSEAEAVVQRLLQTSGPSSETYGVLGRIYKDQWQAALSQGVPDRASTYLDRAIEAYRTGFETDWRDPYPGVNAVTLMTIRQPPDPRRDELLPVVQYAARRKLETGRGDYWDAATLLELSMLGRQEENARRFLYEALALVRAPWETESTVRNLRLIREAVERRGEDAPWMEEVERALTE